MTRLVIEFIRPDGTLLRNVDAGFDYLDEAAVPLVNAELPLRIESDGTIWNNPIPLPDGLLTRVQVTAHKVPVTGSAPTLRARVVVGQMTFDLTVTVAVELRPCEPDTR